MKKWKRGLELQVLKFVSLNSLLYLIAICFLLSACGGEPPSGKSDADALDALGVTSEKTTMPDKKQILGEIVKPKFEKKEFKEPEKAQGSALDF